MGNTCSHLQTTSYSLRGSNSKDSSRMESLPDELLMNILSRVPTLDLLQLSVVCKRWRNILKDPLFHQLHLSHSMSNPIENQVLVLKTQLKLHLVDLAKEKSKSPRQLAIDLPHIPGMKSYHFIGSCNGLLCLHSAQHSRIIVINPITPQHVLYSIHLNVQMISWGFGFDESSNLFKVIVMTLCPSAIKSVVSVCDLGRDGNTYWRCIGETPYLASRMRVPTCFVNKKLHWACYDTFSIISFDLADEEFRRIPTPDGLVDATYSYLIRLGGCLGIVQFLPFQTQNLHIWVMKEYGVESSWVKKMDIGPLLPRTSYLEVFCTLPKVLGLVKDGELVLLNKRGKEPAIVFSSNSTYSEFKHHKLKGISAPWHDLIVHTASLNWV